MSISCFDHLPSVDTSTVGVPSTLILVPLLSMIPVPPLQLIILLFQDLSLPKLIFCIYLGTPQTEISQHLKFSTSKLDSVILHPEIT